MNFEKMKVEQLKEYMRSHNIKPLGGRKAELITRIKEYQKIGTTSNIIYENDIKITPVYIQKEGTKFETMKVVQLKQMLKQSGLKVSGKKSELIQRLVGVQEFKKPWKQRLAESGLFKKSRKLTPKPIRTSAYIPLIESEIYTGPKSKNIVIKRKVVDKQSITQPILSQNPSISKAQLKTTASLNPIQLDRTYLNMSLGKVYKKLVEDRDVVYEDEKLERLKNYVLELDSKPQLTGKPLFPSEQRDFINIIKMFTPKRGYEGMLTHKRQYDISTPLMTSSKSLPKAKGFPDEPLPVTTKVMKENKKIINELHNLKDQYYKIDPSDSKYKSKLNEIDKRLFTLELLYKKYNFPETDKLKDLMLWDFLK